MAIRLASAPLITYEDCGRAYAAIGATRNRSDEVLSLRATLYERQRPQGLPETPAQTRRPKEKPKPLVIANAYQRRTWKNPP